MRMSIVVATRNRAEQLRSCLDALVRQDGVAQDAYEIIVIDNGSTDGTEQIVASIQRQFSQVRCHYEGRMGLSIARNAGVRLAQGDIISFGDDDAIPSSSYVAEVLASFDDPQVDCVGGKIVASWPDGAAPGWFAPKYGNVVGQTSFGETARWMKRDEFPFGGNIAIRREVFQTLGGFNEDLGKRGQNSIWGEEIDLCHRMQEHGYRFFYNPKALVRHVVGRHRATERYFVESLFGKGVTEGYQKLAHKGKAVFTIYLLLKAARLAMTSVYYLSTGTLQSETGRFQLRCALAWYAGYLHFLAVKDNFGSACGLPTRSVLQSAIRNPNSEIENLHGALLMISYEDLASHNGLNTRIKGIARELSAAGRRVEIAAPSYNGRGPETPGHFAGIRVHAVPVPNIFSKWRIPIVTRALSVAMLTLCMVRRLRKSAGPFAWVQSEQVYPFLAACLLARKWKARVILDDPSLLGLFVQEKLRRRRVLRPLLKRAVERFETSLWRRADCILCSSQRTAGAIGERVEGAKTTLFRMCNGVDLSEFTAGPDGGPGNRLFFNCSVPYYQNVAALRNFLKIVARFEQAGFHDYSAVIAVNDATALPSDVMHESALNPRVRLLSNEKSLVPWLHESDLVLLPYEKGHLTTAGPRLKAFEAFACGKIVLGTQEGLDEIPGCIDGHNMILCSDWLDMADKTMGLIAEGETPRKQRIRSEARRLAETEYSWQRLVKAYDTILNNR